MILGESNVTMGREEFDTETDDGVRMEAERDLKTLLGCLEEQGVLNQGMQLQKLENESDFPVEPLDE